MIVEQTQYTCIKIIEIVHFAFLFKTQEQKTEHSQFEESQLYFGFPLLLSVSLFSPSRVLAFQRVLRGAELVPKLVSFWL